MRVLLSLGGNVGDRLARLREAVSMLARCEGVRLMAVSSCYETEPVGVVDQAAFLNLAVEIETAFAPLELLNIVKVIERDIGRTPAMRWGPRMIDIDIILWGRRVMESEVLSIPHPAFRQRLFVLTPLAEIAPGAVDPVTGKTVAALAASPDAAGGVALHTPSSAFRDVAGICREKDH
ncbi:MAG: 2-amino-4-hydroxy-6-hydroxymethyldihydropteridine diphosphokinase [Candidatus Hydrogenedentes bacterium]|nr:2-amino-4-hydroxy-6-hydroxymethyldihydropteridine diphosphokinase [Candidatus Hydrogenedentota bacterium]